METPKFSFKWCPEVLMSAIIALAVMVGSQACTTPTVTTTLSTNTVTGQVTTNSTTNSVLNQATLDTTTLVVDAAIGVGLPLVAQEWPATVPDIKLAYQSLSGVANGASTNSPSQIISLIGQKQSVPALTNAVNLVVVKLSALEQKLLNGSSNNAVVVFRTEAQSAVSVWPPNLQ